MRTAIAAGLDQMRRTLRTVLIITALIMGLIAATAALPESLRTQLVSTITGLATDDEDAVASENDEIVDDDAATEDDAIDNDANDDDDAQFELPSDINEPIEDEADDVNQGRDDPRTPEGMNFGAWVSQQANDPGSPGVDGREIAAAASEGRSEAGRARAAEARSRNGDADDEQQEASSSSQGNGRGNGRANPSGPPHSR